MQEQDKHGSERIHPTGKFALDPSEWRPVWLQVEGIKSIAMKNYHAQDLTQEELERLMEVVNPERKENVKRLKKILEAIKKTLAKPDSAQQQLLNEVDGLMKLNLYDQVVNKLQRQDNATKKPILCNHTTLTAEAESMAIDDGLGLVEQTFKIDDTIFVLSGGGDRANLYGGTLKDDNKLKQAFSSGYVRLNDGGDVHWSSRYYNGNSLTKDVSLKNRVNQDGINCGLFALHEGMLMAKIPPDEYTYGTITKDKEEFCRMMVSYYDYKDNKITHATQAGDWRVGTVADHPQLQLTLKNANIEIKEKNPKCHNEKRNFYFSQVDQTRSSDPSTAYIDTHYHHYVEYTQNNDYKLQTTIDKHTEIITNGLIDAYNEIYGTKKAKFKTIQKILQKAQNDDEWNELREKYRNNNCDDAEKQMLRFSARFQKIMEDKNLMTGSPNATNFVGMRLKRVSSYHMDALEKKLKRYVTFDLDPKIPPPESNFSQPKASNKANLKETHAQDFVEQIMVKHNKHFSTALKEIGVDGKKKDHWMWYIFPQIKGIPEALGQEPTEINNQYSIPDFNTAKELLKNKEFAKNYLKILQAVDDQCQKSGNGYNMGYLEKLFNGDDAKKFVSSITLFDKLPARSTDYTLLSIKKLTNKFFTQGIAQCGDTTKKIQQKNQAQI